MAPFGITEDKSPAATFSLRFSSGSSAGFYVLAPPREVSQADERARMQAMPVEPGMASVRFRLFFHAKPLRHVPDGPVHVSLFVLKAQRPITRLCPMVE